MQICDITRCCKSFFEADQQCHWISKPLGFEDVREDRVGEDESEDLPFASSNMCLRDYGHGNTLYIMLLCGNGTALIRVLAMLLFLCSVTVQAQHVSLDSIYHINEIVVDGHKEVSANQVIGYEQIQALPSSSVADALKYMAGVQIKDYGGLLGRYNTYGVRRPSTSVR